MQSHANVDDAPALAGLEWLQRCLAHCECAQRVDVKHYRRKLCSAIG